MKKRKFNMGWSEADNAYMYVTAHTLEEAEELFEDGIYQLCTNF